MLAMLLFVCSCISLSCSVCPLNCILLYSRTAQITTHTSFTHRDLFIIHPFLSTDHSSTILHLFFPHLHQPGLILGVGYYPYILYLIIYSCVILYHLC